MSEITDAVEKLVGDGQVDMEETGVASELPQKDAKAEESSPSEQPKEAQEQPPATEEKVAEPAVDADQQRKEKAKLRFDKLTKSNRELHERTKAYEQKMAEMEQRLSQLSQPQTSQQLTPEQELAARQLKQILGVDGVSDTIRDLRSTLDSLTKQQQAVAFDNEEKQLLSSIEKMGLQPGQTPDDIVDELDAHIASHPVLSTLRGRPGVYTMAFKDLYFDNLASVSERAATKKQIEFQAKQRKASSEMPSKAPTTAPKKRSIMSDLDAVWKEAGGEEGIDMSL